MSITEVGQQPTLSLLGIPVAWLPYLWLPDTSESMLANMRMPTYSYGEKTGHMLSVPYYAYSSRWTDIILTPTLMSRQGLLMGAEWIQRLTHAFPKFAWINPEPQGVWQYRQSIAIIQQLMSQRMFPLTLKGLEDAMRMLSK